MATLESKDEIFHYVTKHEGNEAHRWDNTDNISFYEAITPQALTSFSLKAGLSTGCDIKLLKPYWETATSILDVGSGYGRVIDALRYHHYQGQVTGVERSSTLFQHLKQKYHTAIHLHHLPTQACHSLKQHFDVIFLLWSGLADFSAAEQPMIIKTLAACLQSNGKLIIDTMPMNVKPLETEQFSQQSFMTRLNNELVYTYEPTTTEIYHYASACGLQIAERLFCHTETNRIRWLYVLSH